MEGAFKIENYKDGSCQYVLASDSRIKYVGRYQLHEANALRKSKCNTVQFDWPHVSCSLKVTNTSCVSIRLKGKGNYFNVFINNAFVNVLRASHKPTCCEAASDLDPNLTYVVTISKRTEPQMRGAITTFKVCTFYGFIIDTNATVLEEEEPGVKKRLIEFIGASDTCAFGNEGPISSANDYSNLKGRLENAHNGYAAISSRLLDADAHIIAWTGKGVHSNALDWGPTMTQLWRRTLASRQGDWLSLQQQQLPSPDAVVLYIGHNDLLPPSYCESDIISSYASLLTDIRKERRDAHIFCLVCDTNCTGVTEDEDRAETSHQLQEITKVALSRVSTHHIESDEKLHYCYIHVPGGLDDDTDYANMMHWSVSGHVKVANALVSLICDKTGWEVNENALESLTPYPVEKKDILQPEESSHCVIC